ncbi:MAG: sugar ABC transporter substrate-binding protein [Herpetosiphon sp.]
MTPFLRVPAGRTPGLRQRLYGSFALLLVGLIGLVGCGSTAPQAQTPFIQSKGHTAGPEVTIGSQKTIALVMKTLTNPFFIEMEKGARRAERELGIHLVVKTAAQETSIDQQIDIVDGLIQAKVDGIVIAPGDSIGLIPVLKKAQDAGIPIINIDNRLDPTASEKLGLVGVPFISVDNEKAAYLSAKVISDQIHTPTNAAVIEGIRSAGNAQDRKHGALRAFGENPSIKVVATETANWKIDEANTVTEELFKHTPDLGAIFCANDMMALGTMQYVSKSVRQHVLVAAFDMLDEVKPFLQSGALAATIDQQAGQQGYLGVQYAVKTQGGAVVPKETLIDVKVVTAGQVH